MPIMIDYYGVMLICMLSQETTIEINRTAKGLLEPNLAFSRPTLKG